MIPRAGYLTHIELPYIYLRPPPSPFVTITGRSPREKRRPPPPPPDTDTASTTDEWLWPERWVAAVWRWLRNTITMHNWPGGWRWPGPSLPPPKKWVSMTDMRIEDLTDKEERGKF